MLERSPTPATHCEVTVQRWRDGEIEQVADDVAEEVPVALTYQGVPHVVMLATPANLEDLAVGFTLSEMIVDSPSEIQSVEAGAREDGALEVRIGIAAAKFSELLRRQRNLTGRTGCGLCGAQTVEDAIRQPKPVSGGVRVDTKSLHAALLAIREQQQINLRTGSVHAAAWVLPDAGIQLVREDVGRHNALDKVIGAVTRAGGDFTSGYFVVTSRASYEMVQKAVTVGGTLLAAVSAPTAFAVRLAEATGLTLIGFARERQHVVYAHPSRLLCTPTT
ncbi:formate dehydrogenase accessory sulfurtransferase FdhD [Steroidobacter sp. S1-65]|uniref:Sulfur carrier protein FdhD n=1 Tax=Steroidobacter gossypii TaxID=2805490 RepID=A0ABS1X1Q8_9GAMM|nr:formate dehydrogenase accessory sulfurtransferase FdhD [Steroidobacter gossypii]MBM0107156.1 formate dehydrogenase accessory sulfurtransferase FdhD [Steroidobacter gossypii]